MANTSNQSTNRNNGAFFENLEPRILFDAVPIGLTDLSTTPDEFVQSATAAHIVDSEYVTADRPAKQVAFVDKSIKDYSKLVAEFVAGQDVEVFLINNGSAGLEQIANHLDGRSDISAIHILSHGNDARLSLGESMLTSSDLTNQYRNELQLIGQALSNDGDIHIYGCNLAGSDAGIDFIQQFSDLTGADVAASEDLTGQETMGGNWTLERTIGSIETHSLSADGFDGVLLETDNGFVVGTVPFGSMNEIAVTPLSEGGVSSRTYTNAATANGGSISIDLRLTLVDTYDENGVLTTGTTDQVPVTFSNFAGGPVLIARNVGSSAGGFQGHTAHIVVEFFDSSTGSPLSVVGDFTFKDIDFISLSSPDSGKGSEAVRAVSDQIESYQISSTPTSNIDIVDNGDGTTTFTNTTNSGGEADQQRWVSIKFHDMPQLNLYFSARNANTGYGLSTANFSSTPISYSQPVATDDNFATDQNTLVSGNVVTSDNGNGTDSDPDSDPLNVYLVNGNAANVGVPTVGTSGGVFTINSTGNLTFDPNGSFDYLAVGESTTTSISYTVRDYTGLAATATVSVTVTGTNDAPTVVGSIPDQSSLDASLVGPIDVSGYFADTDTSDSLSFSTGSTLPPGLSISATTGIISGIIDNAASLSGPYSVLVTATDGNGGTVSQSFAWTIANPGPSATNNTANVKEDTKLSDSGNVLSDDDGSGVDSDPDNDMLIVNSVQGNSGNVGTATLGNYGSITINSNGSYTYSLDNNHADISSMGNGDTRTDSFQYTVSDGQGGTDTATLIVTINGTNDAPVVSSTIPNRSNQDAETISTVDVSGYFSDPEGDTIQFTASNLPAGLSINSAGLITGTIDNDASQNAPGGVHTVVITATDPDGQLVSTSFTWTIINPGPTAVDDSSSTTQATSTTGNVLTNDADPDGDSITVNSIDGSASNTGTPISGSGGGQFTVNANGSYNFDPSGDFDSLAAGETASTSVTYSITDGEGGTDSATLTITVTGTNDTPVVAGTIPTQANNDADTITTLDVSGYFADVDATDTLSFSASGLPTGLAINSAGQITGTIAPSASQSGPFTVTVTANDGNGGTVQQSFTWNVNNPGPNAANDSDATNQSTPATGNVLTNDSDPDGDSIAVNSVDGSASNIGTPITGSGGGQFTVNANGSYNFDPNGEFNSLAAGETAMTSVTYSITDGDGGTDSATLTVTVTGTNDTPVVAGAIPTQTSNDADTIAILDVSGYFADVDATDTLSFSASGLPTGLSINSAGQITGTIDPSASQSGPFTVTVNANDGNGGTVQQSFTWNVNNLGPSAANDSDATSQSTPATGNVLTNDADPDGDSITVNSVDGSTSNIGTPITGSGGGQFTVNANGSYNFNPSGEFDSLAVGETATTSVTYSITDGEGGIDSATLTFTVTGTNDTPIVAGTIPTQANNDADTITTLDVSGYFADVDATDTLSFSASGLPTGLSINSAGQITGTIDPSASQSGPFTVTVNANDGNGGTVQQSFTWNVNNPGPNAGNDSDATNQSASITGNVLTNDADPDGDSITVNSIDGSAANIGTPISGSGGGQFTVNANGSYNFDPNGEFNSLAAGESATTSVTYSITDGEGGTDSATLTVTVTGTNDTPIVAGAIPTQANNDADTITTLDVSGYFADVDATDTLSFTASGLPTGLSINSAGQITGTIAPSASQSGPFAVTVTANDGNGGTVQQSFTWNVNNPGPNAANDSDATNQSAPATGDVLTNDADPDGDSITVNSVDGSASNIGTPIMGSGGGQFTVNANGSYSFNPNGEFNSLAAGETATTSVTYSITDGEGGTDSATLTVTVTGTNDTPIVAGTIPTQTNNDADTITTLDVSGYFSDVDATDTLSFSASGLPTGLAINSAGQITGTIDPSASQSGPFTVTVTANDGNGGTVQQSFTWNVNNPGPIATDNSANVVEDSQLTDVGNVISDDDGNGSDSDPDFDTLVVGSVNGLVANVGVSVNGSFGTLLINSDGSYIYTLDNVNPSVSGLSAGETLSEQFDYSVNDGQGGSASANLVITIHGDNDAPITGGTIPAQFNLDSDTITTLDISSFFSDPEGHALTFTATGLPTGLGLNLNSGAITGTVGSSASQDQTAGVHTVIITATDDALQTVSSTFTWTIANPPPIAVGDHFLTNEDTVLSGSVASNDSDPDGDSVTFGVVANPANGTLVLNPDGSFVYSPVANFFGTDTFEYSVTDVDGSVATATTTISIASVNDAPDLISSIPGQSDMDGQSLSLDVASYFTDVDGDSLTFNATGLPPGLTIDTSGTISGTIDANASASGPYAVEVTANDGNGGVQTGAFNWTVSNPAPVAGNDFFVMTEDLPFTGSVSANDNDPDGDSITFVLLTPPSNGVIGFAADGTFTYSPNTNFNGIDSFEYQVIDANGASDTAIATLQVTPVNDIPIVAATLVDQLDLDGDAITLDLSGHFSDPDNDVLEYSATGLPTGLTIDNTGIISGTIDSSASQAGPYAVEVTVVDGNGGTVAEAFVWTISNPSPTATDNSNSVFEDTSFAANGNVISDNDGLGIDSDPDSDMLQVTKLNGLPGNVGIQVAGNYGVIQIESDGTYNYVVDNSNSVVDSLGVGEFLVESFGYTIDDGQGGTSSATLTVTIHGTDDAPTATTIPNQTSNDSETISILDTSLFFQDAEDDSLVFSATGLPLGLTIDPLTGKISGVIQNDASVSSSNGDGEYTVQIVATDDSFQTATVQFSWSISNPPPIAIGDTFVVDEDSTISQFVSGNDSDPDGDALDFTRISGPANGTLVFNNDGSFTYTPNANFNGVDSFEYQLRDAQGATSIAEVEIIVVPVNDAPNAFDNFQSTIENSTSIGNVLTDNDGFGVDSDIEVDVLVVAKINGHTTKVAQAVSGSNGGSFIINIDGSYAFEPGNDFDGLSDGESTTTSVNYSISDENGGQSTATLTIEVVGQNDAPVVVSLIPNYSVVDGNSINPIDFSPHFYDVDANDSLIYSTDGNLPPGLTIDPMTGVVSGTVDSAASTNGPYVVQIIATDSAGDSIAQTITINAFNPPPVATDDSGELWESGNYVVALIGNDSDIDQDGIDVIQLNGIDVAPGDTIELASGARLTLNSDGTADYATQHSFEHLKSGEQHIEVFEYTITDGQGGYDTASAIIKINGVNDAPMATDDSITTFVDQPVTINVLGNDEDIDHDSLAVIIVTPPALGTAVVNTDGSITYTPTAGYVGEQTLTYLVEDPSGATSEAVVTIDVKTSFAFDNFTNFSNQDAHGAGDRFSSVSSSSTQRVLSQKIFTLAPEPIFSGYARPGTQIIGRIYNASGTLVSEATATSDPGGNWMMQFNGARGFEFLRIEFDQIAETIDVFGYLGLNPSDNSYQAMEALTYFERPLSVENALNSGAQSQIQSAHRTNNRPIGFGIGTQ